MSEYSDTDRLNWLERQQFTLRPNESLDHLELDWNLYIRNKARGYHGDTLRNVIDKAMDDPR